MSFTSAQALRSLLPGLLLLTAAGATTVQRHAAPPTRTSSTQVAGRATGGAIDSSGLFLAGRAAGSYRVMATERGGARADTSVVSIAAPPATTLISPPAPATRPSPKSSSAVARDTVAGGGIPFGPYGAWEDEGLKSNVESFNLSIGALTPR